jgi:hypothetical protein
VLDADLRWRGPAGYKQLFRRVGNHAFAAVASSRGREQLRAVFDLKFPVSQSAQRSGAGRLGRVGPRGEHDDVRGFVALLDLTAASERPSPTLNALPMMALQRYIGTPRLAWDFLTLHEPEPWDEYFALVDQPRAAGADFQVGGRRYGLYGHDFRRVPVGPSSRPQPAASHPARARLRRRRGVGRSSPGGLADGVGASAAPASA